MNTSTKAKIAAASLSAMALFGAAGCKNSETPAAKCECPNGTIHEAGEACCDGVGCACKEVKYYEVTFQDKKIPVEDRSGEKVTQKELGIIQNSLNSTELFLFTNDLPALGKATNNLSKIIIKDVAAGDSDRIGGVIYLDFDYLSGLAENSISLEIDNQIWNIILDSALTFNKSNSNIRLANGKNMNIGKRRGAWHLFS
jgi:hypothetical protein